LNKFVIGKMLLSILGIICGSYLYLENLNSDFFITLLIYICIIFTIEDKLWRSFVDSYSDLF